MYLRKHALSLAIALAASPALADTSAEEPIVLAELAPVTVTATRDNKTEKEATRSVATVSPESIESRQASSAPELVKDIPNVTTVGGPRSENQSINIRGLEGARVLQLVDGARQVFESGHRPSYFIEPELIRSAEVIRGPASNLWGSGAVGGVADDFPNVGHHVADTFGVFGAVDEVGHLVRLAREHDLAHGRAVARHRER